MKSEKKQNKDSTSWLYCYMSASFELQTKEIKQYTVYRDDI